MYSDQVCLSLKSFTSFSLMNFLLASCDSEYEIFLSLSEAYYSHLYLIYSNFQINLVYFQSYFDHVYNRLTSYNLLLLKTKAQLSKVCLYLSLSLSFEYLQWFFTQIFADINYFHLYVNFVIFNVFTPQASQLTLNHSHLHNHHPGLTQL